MKNKSVFGCPNSMLCKKELCYLIFGDAFYKKCPIRSSADVTIARVFLKEKKLKTTENGFTSGLFELKTKNDNAIWFCVKFSKIKYPMPQCAEVRISRFFFFIIKKIKRNSKGSVSGFISFLGWGWHCYVITCKLCNEKFPKCQCFEVTISLFLLNKKKINKYIKRQLQKS